MTVDAGTPAAPRRVAGGPISWGGCEVPGCGRQLPPDRVLAEMAGLGLTATELGPQGWLPADPAALLARLHAHGLALLGGFVPLVLHEPAPWRPPRGRERIASAFAAGNADVFVAALVMDDAWSAPEPLDATSFGRLAT